MRPFAIVLQSGEPYAFAGLWETWQPPEGALLETFTILTTAPNSLTEPIHDRMPVIVEPKDYDRWMDPSTAPPLDLLRPYPQRRCGRDGFRFDVKSQGRSLRGQPRAAFRRLPGRSGARPAQKPHQTPVAIHSSAAAVQALALFSF